MMMSPGFQQRLELFDHGVDRLAGLDHDQDAARLLQGVDEFLQRLGADEVAVVPCFSSRASVFSTDRLCRATVKPLRARLRARLAPITARPVTPMCAVPFDQQLAR